jgi:hypothetical protein
MRGPGPPVRIRGVRVLAAIGALAFLYLALIPAGLIYSTLDSACAGEGCETSVASRIAFTALYGACLAAVLGTAALFAHYAVSGSPAAERRLPRALGATGAVVGTVLFALFFVAFPLGGAVALGLALTSFILIRFRGPGSENGPSAPPSRLAPLPGPERSGNGAGGAGNGTGPG